MKAVRESQPSAKAPQAKIDPKDLGDRTGGPLCEELERAIACWKSKNPDRIANDEIRVAVAQRLQLGDRKMFSCYQEALENFLVVFPNPNVHFRAAIALKKAALPTLSNEAIARAILTDVGYRWPSAADDSPNTMSEKFRQRRVLDALERIGEPATIVKICATAVMGRPTAQPTIEGLLKDGTLVIASYSSTPGNGRSVPMYAIASTLPADWVAPVFGNNARAQRTKKVLGELLKLQQATLKELSLTTGIHIEVARISLKDLRDQKLVELVGAEGSGRGSYYQLIDRSAAEKFVQSQEAA